MSKHHMSRDCQVQKPLEPDQTILAGSHQRQGAHHYCDAWDPLGYWYVGIEQAPRPSNRNCLQCIYSAFICDLRFTILLDSISLTHAWFYIVIYIYICFFDTWPKRGSEMGLAENRAFLNALVNHNVPNEIGILGVYHVFRQTQIMVMYTINTPYIHDSPIPFYIGWFTIHHHIPLQSSYNEITFIRIKSHLMIHYS